MNTDDIRQLAQIMDQHGLGLIKIKDKDYYVRLERPGKADVQPAPVPAITAQVETPEPLMEETDPHMEAVDFNRVREVKSPMVGGFYPKPAPDKPPFVEKGDRVKKGDVLCIIEAMKMMNEIVAEEDGTVVDICAEEGQLVEFSQVLYKLF